MGILNVSLREAALVTALLCTATVAVSAQEATAVIRGRLVAADSALPIPDGTIQLMPVLSGPINMKAAAAVIGNHAVDREGAFEIPNVPAGRYRVSASPGVSTQGYLPERYVNPQSGAEELVVAPGLVESVTISLPRAGAIEGRVLNEHGMPVAFMSMYAQVRSPEGLLRPHLVPAMVASRFLTDDNGRFRVFGLRPGSYLLAAQPSESFSSGRVRDKNSVVQTTFYPSVISSADAIPIEVRAGETTGPVELQMRRVRSSALHGTVVDRTGQNVAGITVTLRRGDRSSTTTLAPYMQTQSTDRGAFAFENVVEGDYLLTAFRAGEPREFAHLALAIDNDMRNVLLSLKEPGSAAGTVVFEGTKPTGANPLRIKPVPIDGGEPMPAVQVREDGSFLLEDLVGIGVIAVEGAPEWTLKSVEYAGTDITGQAVNLDSLSGPLTVTVIKGTGTLTGTVTNADGHPVPAMVYLVATTSLNQKLPPAIRYAQTDGAGRYNLQNLRLGSHRVVAVPIADAPGANPSREAIALLAGRATSVAISAQPQSMDLRVVVLR